MKKKKRVKPKVRHVWTLNPKTRVKKSKKVYTRAEEQKKVREIIKEIGWFGEKY